MKRRAPRLLLLAMYRLDRDVTGPTLRIGQVRNALARRVELDVISGTRMVRAGAFIRYVFAGRLRGLAGIYVESSSSLPGPADLLFLAVARVGRARVLTYVRDAYQLFPEYYPLDSLKRRIGRHAFLPAFRALARVSSAVAFPSRGLAHAVLRDTDSAASAPLLPPGAQLPETVVVDPTARGILYVGSLAHAASGGDLLLQAMRLVRERGRDLELICVAPPGQGPAPPHPPWLSLVRASGSEIDRLLPRVLATVTPRLRTPYNDLAVPIKVMEYLGYGRPLIVTDATETAAIVQAAGCGVVVADTPEALAAGIETVAGAQPEQLARWGQAARRAAEANSWDARADRILELLGVAA